MNPRQPAANPAAEDAEWAGRLRAAADADARQLARAARRRRQARWLAGGLTVVVVAVLGIVLVRTGTFTELFAEDTAGTPSVSRIAPAPTVASPMFDENRPFTSTPAADWAGGTSGIVTPPARRVGEFSQEQVTLALARVREILVASRLDRDLLVDHNPRRFLSLLAPDARRQLEPLFSGGEPLVQSLVSMTSADSRLLSAEPKVQGEMTVSAGDAGELVISTNYVFVYAFEPEEPLRLVDAMNAIVVVRADVDYVLRASDRWAEGSKGLWYGEATGYAYSIGCEAYLRGYLAPASAERAVTTQPEQTRSSYFDPRSPAPPPSCPSG
ncbi:hypothetical protein [Actinophytocola sediminis]